MKKQLFTIILAIFAIVTSTSSLAQTLAPRLLECIDLDDPLNVVAGQPYTYKINVPTPTGAKTYHWFVTQDINMITGTNLTATIQTAGGSILATGSGSYNSATNALNEVTLTFKSFRLATNQYCFVGIFVENTDATTGCTTSDLKVYRILPVHAFSLDIANVNATGTIQTNYGQDNLTTCMADILTASYDPITNKMAYDFNENTFYYAVAAANFSGKYRLSVQLDDLTSSQTATMTWGYTFATATNALAPAGSPNGTYTADISAQHASGAVGKDGETIFIKLVIDHGTQFEGNLASTIQHSLAVNGNLLDDSNALIAGAADVHHLGGTCAQVDFDDIALQSLIPRPTITSVSPAAPDNYLPIKP